MQTTSERQLAIKEARRLLELDLVIFDTETTGLGPDAEIVEVAALKVDGTVLLDTLVKPRQFIPPEATAVHGITDADAAGSPPIEAVLPRIRGRDQHLASYNLAFDERLIRRSLDLGGPAAGSWYLPAEQSHCIMEIYARYHGAWSDYHHSYTFQSLGNALAQCGLEFEGQPHRAMTDARAAAALLRYMAYGWA